MKIRLYPPVFLFCSLLLPALVGQSQTAILTGTVTTEQELRQVNFDSPNGKIKVLLPADLSNPTPGTVTLTGTVIAEPVGLNDKEKARNLKTLQKSVIKLGGTTLPFFLETNSFQFSLPPQSNQPIKINCTSALKEIVELALNQPILSVPPSTVKLLTGQPTLFTDQHIYLGNGNLAVYTPNNVATLFQPADKFYIKDASGKVLEAVKLTGTPTQTILAIPAGTTPGPIEISRSGKINDKVNTRIATLSLSSPNTPLASGQTSTLTVTIDPKITEKDTAEAMQIPVMNLDVRNLTPAIIELSGGNAQLFVFPVRPKSILQDDWKISRTITGITPGGFAISATLQPTRSNSRFWYGMQNASLTVTAFNQWINAVKSDLAQLYRQTNSAERQKLITETIAALRSCGSGEDPALCKIMARHLLRNLHLSGFKLPDLAVSLLAYRLESSKLNGTPLPAQGVLQLDDLRTGLNYFQQRIPHADNPLLRDQVQEALRALTAVESNYTVFNLARLQNAIKKINATPSIAAMIEKPEVPADSYQQADEFGKTLVGYLDPEKKTLFVDPKFQEQILASLGGVRRSDNRYLIQSMNAKRSALYYDVAVTPATAAMLLNVSQDWWVKELNERLKKDSAAGKLIGTVLDSTSGTWYRFFRDAACKLAEKAETPVECSEEVVLVDNPQTGQKDMKNTGNYFSVHFPESRRCVKGNDFCTEVLMVWKIVYTYADKECKLLKNVETTYNFSCK
jgi:hypothetical protein